MTINALVTGSRKYGSPRRDSDVDVALFVSEDVFDNLWSLAVESGDHWLCLFDQVKFIESKDDDVIVDFHHDVVDIYCEMSEADRDLLGGLHKWLKVDGSQAFASTFRNNAVNVVPVFDSEIWVIWVDGTEALAASGESVDREDAIEFFTSLGMPRFDS